MNEQAQALEIKAVELLDRVFLRLPPGISSGSSVELVACIVKAAMLRMADSAGAANE